MITAEELLHIPDPSDTERIELVEGEIVTRPILGIWPSIHIGRLSSSIFEYVYEHGLGWMTGGKGGYIVGRDPDTVLAPKIGFIQRWHFPGGLPQDGYPPFPPDLVVEFFTDYLDPDLEKVRERLYRTARTPLIWWVNLTTETVRVIRPDHEDLTLDRDGILDGLTVLPGFWLLVSTIFEEGRF